jgi:hypothetical protein
MKLVFFIALLILSSGPANAERAAALDTSQFAGTVSVEFHPMQAAGVLGGCTLVYTLAQQDFVYRNGTLISIVGNIAYFTNRARHDWPVIKDRYGRQLEQDSKARGALLCVSTNPSWHDGEKQDAEKH